jgi:hypothetical protein
MDISPLAALDSPEKREAFLSGLSAPDRLKLDGLLAAELTTVRSVERLEALRGWSPRSYQKALWGYLEGGGKRAVAIWHRRSGKDDVALNWAARAAHERVGEYWHMLPEAAQGRKAIWDAVSPHTGRKRIDQAFPRELRARTREQDMVIQFTNGSLWRVVGSDNYESLLGSTPAGVVFSEWALADPAAWAFIRPILIENNGWAMFITTPRGSNHARTTLTLSQSDPGWFGQVLAAKDTGVFTSDQLAAELKEYQYDYGLEEGAALFDQEYNCSFEAALIGSYYGPYLTRATKDGRIGVIPVDRGALVHTAWDLGVSDASGIWFIQAIGKERRLVAYHETSGVGLDEYARILEDYRQQHKWVYGDHYFPHDIVHRELSNNGLSREDTLRGLGVKVKVVPQSSVMDGINAVRRLLDYAWIDEKRCERGLNALRNYRRAWNEKLKMFADAPLHDWACVTGDTKVLTRYGTYPICNLSETGEVWTPCGWRQYYNPRITRRDASLVEVRFTDGLSVRCTAEHLFLTESGWKFAEHLQKGIAIQSSLTRSRSIGMAASIVFGRAKDTMREAANAFISLFGRPSMVPSLAGVTSTTAATTTSTTDLRIWNACQWASTYRSLGVEGWKRDERIPSIKRRETKPPLGTNPMRDAFGIADMLSAPNLGKNGSAKRGRVWSAVSRSIASFVRMVISKSSALSRARPLVIASVTPLAQRSDVWCLTVPDGGCWSLANGAVTHNSHGADALRTFAAGFREPKERPQAAVKIPTYGQVPTSHRGSGWMR